MVAAMGAGELPGVPAFGSGDEGFPLTAARGSTVALDLSVGLVDGVGLDGPCCALLLGRGAP
jgi:hypothetical protein